MKRRGNGMKYDEDGSIHHDYIRQQNALDEIARKLGVVCFRPDYHGAAGDKNTVLFYTKDDEEHNRNIDTKFSGLSQESKNQMYRRAFWTFENTDANGLEDYGFANFGRICLRGIRAGDTLEGCVRLAYAKHRQNRHIAAEGGVWGLREADSVLNDLNREIIEAIRLRDGSAFVGRINYHGEQHKAVARGEMSVYEECKGQMIYNFCADFVVPKADEELEKCIRAWNGDDRLPKSMASVEKITDRVEALGGINLFWT